MNSEQLTADGSAQQTHSFDYLQSDAPFSSIALKEEQSEPNAEQGVDQANRNGSASPNDEEATLIVYQDDESQDTFLGSVQIKSDQTIGELRHIIRTKLGHRPAFQLFNGRTNTLLGPRCSRQRVLDTFCFPQENVALVRKKIKKGPKKSKKSKAAADDMDKEKMSKRAKPPSIDRIQGAAHRRTNSLPNLGVYFPAQPSVIGTNIDNVVTGASGNPSTESSLLSSISPEQLRFLIQSLPPAQAQALLQGFQSMTSQTASAPTPVAPSNPNSDSQNNSGTTSPSLLVRQLQVTDSPRGRSTSPVIGGELRRLKTSSPKVASSRSLKSKSVNGITSSLSAQNLPSMSGNFPAQLPPSADQLQQVLRDAAKHIKTEGTEPGPDEEMSNWTCPGCNRIGVSHFSKGYCQQCFNVMRLRGPQSSSSLATQSRSALHAALDASGSPNSVLSGLSGAAVNMANLNLGNSALPQSGSPVPTLKEPLREGMMPVSRTPPPAVPPFSSPSTVGSSLQVPVTQRPPPSQITGPGGLSYSVFQQLEACFRSDIPLSEQARLRQILSGNAQNLTEIQQKNFLKCYIMDENHPLLKIFLQSPIPPGRAATQPITQTPLQMTAQGMAMSGGGMPAPQFNNMSNPSFGFPGGPANQMFNGNPFQANPSIAGLSNLLNMAAGPQPVAASQNAFQSFGGAPNNFSLQQLQNLQNMQQQGFPGSFHGLPNLQNLQSLQSSQSLPNFSSLQNQMSMSNLPNQSLAPPPNAFPQFSHPYQINTPQSLPRSHPGSQRSSPVPTPEKVGEGLDPDTPSSTGSNDITDDGSASKPKRPPHLAIKKPSGPRGEFDSAPSSGGNRTPKRGSTLISTEALPGELESPKRRRQGLDSSSTPPLSSRQLSNNSNPQLNQFASGGSAKFMSGTQPLGPTSSLSRSQSFGASQLAAGLQTLQQNLAQSLGGTSMSPPPHIRHLNQQQQQMQNSGMPNAGMPDKGPLDWNTIARLLAVQNGGRPPSLTVDVEAETSSVPYQSPISTSPFMNMNGQFIQRQNMLNPMGPSSRAPADLRDPAALNFEMNQSFDSNLNALLRGPSGSDFTALDSVFDENFLSGLPEYERGFVEKIPQEAPEVEQNNGLAPMGQEHMPDNHSM